MPIVPPTLRAGTHDLPAVPPVVQYLIGSFLAPILAWVSSLVYRQVLTRCATHPLVVLAQWYCPTQAIAACAGFHHRPGTPGALPTYSIDQFVRVELVRAWAESCSDPELEALLATNLLVRWFVGLPLLGPTPDHATLAAFHAWMTIHAPDALFADVLRFLDRVDPEAPTTPQIVDTFAMASPVAPSRTVAHLLTHLAQRMTRLWRTQTPADLHTIFGADDLAALTTVPFARTASERQQRLHTIVMRVQRLSAALVPHLAACEPALHTVLVSYQTAIAKVIADELACAADGQWYEVLPAQRGASRIASALDREATFRKHEGSPAVLGSNAVVSTTATRIRACVALTGSSPDSLAPAAVLEQQRDSGHGLPSHLVMDQAGGWGKTRASTDAISDGQTMQVARVPTSGGSDPNRFSVADFQIDAAQTQCRCPNGVVSTRRYPPGSGEGDGVSFRFLASQCRACPLWQQCRDPQANPKGHRSVYLSEHHHYLRAGAAFNHTAQGRALLAGRWQVEPTIAWLVRYHGCREARRVGQAAAQCQLFQACAVRNVLLWLSRIRRGLSARPECR